MLLLVLILTLFISGDSYADIIKLDNDMVIEGKIIEVKDGCYIIKTIGGGKRVVPKNRVTSIKEKDVKESDLYSLHDIYEKKVEQLDILDPDSQFKLAEWCYKNGFFEMAKKHYEAVLNLGGANKKEAEDRINFINNLEIEKLLSDLQIFIDEGQYLQAENGLLYIIAKYPDNDGSKLAEDKLIQIWGNKKAKELIENLLEAKDTLPQVAPDIRNLRGIIEYLSRQNMSIDAYYNKCLKKGDDFAERAEEIRRDRIKEYYIDKALYCYYLVAYGAEKDSKVYKLALAKAKRLCDKYNIDNYKETFLSNLRR
jgi:hypothetical protein